MGQVNGTQKTETVTETAPVSGASSESISESVPAVVVAEQTQAQIIADQAVAVAVAVAETVAAEVVQTSSSLPSLSSSAVVDQTEAVASTTEVENPVFDETTSAGKLLKIMYDGVTAYLKNTSFSIISFHGKAGKIRANKLLQYITRANASDVENKTSAAWILLKVVIGSGSTSMKNYVTDIFIDNDTFKAGYKDEVNTIAVQTGNNNVSRDDAINLMVRVNLDNSPNAVVNVIVHDINDVAKPDEISEDNFTTLMNFN